MGIENKPEVSVIIPTYNRASELKKAIESVQNQTFKNWEAIIIDDRSTDNTREVVRIWKLRDKRVKYYTTVFNSGSPVIPRNLGVKVADGDYIAFLDSDDTWLPTKLEKQLKLMKSKKSMFSYHDLTVSKDDVYYNDWSKMSCCHEGMVFKQLLRKNFIPTSSVMMRKDSYSVFKEMDHQYKISHDWDLWLKIAETISIQFLNEKLGVLNLHKGSVITEAHKRRVECRKIIKKWKEKCNKKDYNKIMAYYYFIEIIDIMPNFIQNFIRKIVYGG